MTNDFHELGQELVRFLDEFPPTTAGQRYPAIMKLVLQRLDDCMRADQGLPPPPRPANEDGAGGGCGS